MKRKPCAKLAVNLGLEGVAELNRVVVSHGVLQFIGREIFRVCVGKRKAHAEFPAGLCGLVEDVNDGIHEACEEAAAGLQNAKTLNPNRENFRSKAVGDGMEDQVEGIARKAGQVIHEALDGGNIERVPLGDGEVLGKLGVRGIENCD